MTQKSPNQRVGRPSILSKERILEAAASLDTNELTFRKVATELGVTAQSLYRYFANLEELRSALAVEFIDKTEILDDHPPGDFESYLVRFVLDYRDWLVENDLNPALFSIEYGAARFEKSAVTEPLLIRLEDFLDASERENVPLDTAMKIWWALTDWMASTRSTRLQERFVSQFHDDLAGSLMPGEPDRFPRIRSYLTEPTSDTLTSGEIYEFSARAIVRGLLIQTGLRESDTDA